MITVMGATGRIGSKITNLLLKQGESVRALGRSERKLSELQSAGAEVLAGDASDAAFLTNAFRGATAVFTLLPYDPQSSDYRAIQDRQGEAIVKAVRESGVRYVVALSSVGADQPSGTGPIAGLHAQEERLRRIDDVNLLLLRPGSFFENFYDSLELIKHEGIIGDSVAPEVALPMIATRDIADAAAKALTARDWKGVVVRELLGPCDLSYAEATCIIGERIGKPDLAYVQFPYADMAEALMKVGFSENVAGLYVEMTRAFNEGRVKPCEGRKPENTTPTRLRRRRATVTLARAGHVYPTKSDLRLSATVDAPRGAVSIRDHSELVGPERLAERHRDSAALSQRCKDALRLGCGRVGQGHHHAVDAGVGHTGWRVASH
jgi:uncharacterized protein YbjT (DUF2867 family)